jgi:FkbM family methyltransferase
MNRELGSPCPAEAKLLRKCFLDKHRDTLRTLKPDQALNSSSLISSRLDSAAKKQLHKKYTFIPAAVSDVDSWLEIRQSFLGLLIGGTTTSGKDADFSSLGDEYFPTVYVRTVNLTKWLEMNFKQEDRIVVKMDIEGAEHDVINSMIKTGTHKLIDVLAWECHSKGGDCGVLKKALKTFTDIKVLEEGKDYNGWKD